MNYGTYKIVNKNKFVIQLINKKKQQNYEK